MKRLFVLLVPVFLGTVVHGQVAQDRIVEGLEYRLLNFPQEKVYIHHDKPVYVLGEVIWYRCYLVDAIYHQTLTPSLQVNVELYGPEDELIEKQIIRMEDGGRAGEFKLDPELDPGRYFIRAYTAYQKNFAPSFMYEKEIRVYDAYASIRDPDVPTDSLVTMGNAVLASGEEYDEVNLNFFPEGGAMVAGLPTTVAVNAFDAEGNGLSISGTVTDSDRNVVSRFNTHETGLGFFTISPQVSERYTARIAISSDKELAFQLPRVESDGYSLRIRGKRDTLTITANTTRSSGLDGAFIVGHMRGRLFGVIEGLTGSGTSVRVPLTGTPEGILHFTLFSPNGSPLSERLVFHMPDDLGQVLELDLSADRYTRRSQVEINIASLIDTTGFEGSLTVTDLGLATPAQYASNILTYLLLESDLRGRIPNPGFFFEEGAANKKLLDVLMLTHGWKRFEWQDISGKRKVRIDYMPEQALTIAGYTTKENKPDKPVQTRVFLTMVNEDFQMQQQITTPEGEFEFGGIVVYDTVQVTLQAEVYKVPKNAEKAKKKLEEEQLKLGPDGNRYVDIRFEPEYIDQLERNNAILDPDIPPNRIMEYFSESRRTQVVDSAYQDMISVTLDEVVVTREKYDPVAEEQKRLMWYNEPDSRVYPDSLPVGSLSRNVFELIRGTMPGVEVLGTFPNYQARIRGINSIKGNTFATYVIDGVPVDAQLVNNFPVERIAFIDVLRSLNKSAIYGSGGNGVIAIYSKTNEQMAQSTSQPGLLNFLLPGYHKAETYYSPDYGAESDNDKPDFRTTLYWNPDISISASDQDAKVRFYTSDRASVYSVRLEGITADGRPVALSKLLEVQ